MKKNTFEMPSLEKETLESLSAKLLIAHNELIEANHKLHALQKEREEILSNISHDLRSPITAIRSAIDYLTSGANISAEDYQLSIQMIDHRTKTLENLIQDMYLLFCAQDTSKELSLETIDAAAFFEEYFFDLGLNSLYDEHQLKLDMPESLTCTLNIDIQKIILVLDNLFTNAAKYSGTNSTITLSVHLSSTKDTLEISVCDNGIGIPADALPHIFNRTFTVSNARTPNSTTGSGLGLSIAKAIVERHNGTISCTSTEGKGSTFTFCLPLT